MCSFCCVASVVKSVVSVSFSTGFHLNNTLFHSGFVIEQSDGSGSGGCTDFHAHKHHKHKVYQHMYSYNRTGIIIRLALLLRKRGGRAISAVQLKRSYTYQACANTGLIKCYKRYTQGHGDQTLAQLYYPLNSRPRLSTNFNGPKWGLPCRRL